MTDFDMPAQGTWEQRGGWVVNALAKEFQLTKEQAAGIVGNLGFESIGFTKLHEIGQREGVGGYGFGQWTASRRETFFAFAKKAGRDWSSDQANYGYLVHELHTTHAYCLKALRQELTLDRCVFVFGRMYEAPGGTTETHLPGYDGRLSYAQRALTGAMVVGVSTPALTPVAGPSVPIPSAREMQTTLAALGFYHDAIDGDFGPRSQAALAAYLRQK